MSAIMRGRGIEEQYVTSDLDASRVIFLPEKNRHRFVVRAHPDNDPNEGVWVHLIRGSEAPAGGKLVDVAGVALDVDDLSNNPAIDATDTNSGIFLGPGEAFTDDTSGQFIFDGAMTAIGSAAGQKLVILGY